MCMGLDSAKEEMDDYENRFLEARACDLSSTGRARAEAEYDFALCPEYEKPAKAVFDFSRPRSDVDPLRAGISRAYRSAATTRRAPRVRETHPPACARSRPLPALGRFQRTAQMNVVAFRVRSKSANLEDAGRSRCALLSPQWEEHHLPDLHRRGDERPPDAAHRRPELAASVSGPCVLSVIEGGNTSSTISWYRYRDQTADWWRRSWRCEALACFFFPPWKGGVPAKRAGWSSPRSPRRAPSPPPTRRPTLRGPGLRLIVPFPPGARRTSSPALSGRKTRRGLGAAVVIDNRPGAGLDRLGGGGEGGARRLHAGDGSWDRSR